MTIDAKIASHHVLKNRKLVINDKYETWSQLVDSKKKKKIKNQGREKSLLFKGKIETDGLGVSIIAEKFI